MASEGCGLHEHGVKNLSWPHAQGECPGHLVLLRMANSSTNSECRRNQGSRIYRIPGKITEPRVQSCRTLLTLSGAVSRCHRVGAYGTWARCVGMNKVKNRVCGSCEGTYGVSEPG